MIKLVIFLGMLQCATMALPVEVYAGGHADQIGLACSPVALLPPQLTTDADAVQRATIACQDHTLALTALPRRQWRAVQAEVLQRRQSQLEHNGGLAAWTAALAERGDSELGWQVVTQTELALDRLTPEIVVPEATVRERFEKRWGRFVTPAQVHFLEIAVPMPTATKADTEVAMATMITAHERLQRGEPFAIVASTLSQAPSRQAGGDRGWTASDALDAKTQAELIGLRDNQTSRIFSTAWGLHIVHLVARRPSHPPTLDEARPLVFAECKNELQFLARRAWLSAARAKAKLMAP